MSMVLPVISCSVGTNRGDMFAARSAKLFCTEKGLFAVLLHFFSRVSGIRKPRGRVYWFLYR